MDPVLHLIAHLYRMGCFGDDPVEKVFSRDLLLFPTKADKAKYPIFSTAGNLNPTSGSYMSELFKKYVIQAGFPRMYIFKSIFIII